MSKLSANVLLKYIIIACSVLIGFGEVLPPEIQKCKSTDNNDCISNAIMDVLKRYPEGNSEFGLLNVSSITLNDVVVSESNSGSPIQIDFKYNSVTVTGLEKVKILRSSGFDKEFKKTVEVDVLIPSLSILGDYESTGKLLLLPINGKGKGHVTLKDSFGKIRVKVQLVKRDDKTYVKIKKLKILLEPKKMIANMENIFNGNPTLSASINSVINENWRDVWTELGNGINGAIERIVTKVIGDVLYELPLDEFYLD